MGGTGFQPVVSGVAPETGETSMLSLAVNAHPPISASNEIRRDAGFDGRDARDTHRQYPLEHGRL